MKIGFGELAEKQLSEFSDPVNAVANLLGYISSIENDLNQARKAFGCDQKPTLIEGLTSRINKEMSEK